MNRYRRFNEKRITKREARHTRTQGTPRPAYRTPDGRYHCVKLSGSDWGKVLAR